jgi:hypothetical protein
MPTIRAHGLPLTVLTPPNASFPTAQGRTILVLGGDPELATALRDRLDRAYVTVIEAGPADALGAMRSCRPWPWMAIGAGRAPGAEVVAEISRSPVLVVWRGAHPVGLPAHSIAATRFSEVVGAVEAALHADVGGVRLDIGGGLAMPGGAHSGNATLEALVAAHPRPLFLTPAHLRSAVRALSVHRVPLRPVRLAGGAVVLAPVGGG